MPGSSTTAYIEPEDFETALRLEGCISLLITGRDHFRAQLTQITLHRLRVSALEEQVSRIAFITVPVNTVMISFLIDPGTRSGRAGTQVRSQEIKILRPGEYAHDRTDGPRRWGTIWISLETLVRFGSALTGSPFAVPPFTRCWRPPADAGRQLRSLHGAAIRMATSQPRALMDAQTAYGLEQQLIEALVHCLSSGAGTGSTRRAQRGRDIMIRFEELIQREAGWALNAAELSAGLGISERLLRNLSSEYLGMSPIAYGRRRRMALVRRSLRHPDQASGSVSEVARRYGFLSLGRFAASYHATFGELPSATLQRAQAAA